MHDIAPLTTNLEEFRWLLKAVAFWIMILICAVVLTGWLMAKTRQLQLRNQARQFGDFPKNPNDLPGPDNRDGTSSQPSIAERASLAVATAIVLGHGLFLLFPEGLS